MAVTAIAINCTLKSSGGEASSTDRMIEVLGNDKPGDPGTPLKPSSLCLVDAGKCVVMVNVVGQAKYVPKSDGKVDIEPVPGFFGPARPVTYRVADSNGTTDGGSGAQPTT